jgi:hypothetical protein
MLLGRDAALARRAFAEAQELTQVVAEPGEPPNQFPVHRLRRLRAMRGHSSVTGFDHRRIISRCDLLDRDAALQLEEEEVCGGDGIQRYPGRRRTAPWPMDARP